jgi:hypothetical protein
MIVSKMTEAVIYESPDGGKTVYVREPGSPVQSRKLHWESEDAKDLREQILEDKLWGNIRRAAKTNHTIQRALDEAILLYNLSK